MSEIATQCHGCGQQYAIDGSYAGQQLPCPSCGASVSVPLPSSVAAGGPAAVAAPQSPSNASREVNRGVSELVSRIDTKQLRRHWPHVLIAVTGVTGFLIWVIAGFSSFGMLMLMIGAGLAAFGWKFPGRVAYFDQMPSMPTMLFSAFTAGGGLGAVVIALRWIGRMGRSGRLEENVGWELWITILSVAGVLGLAAFGLSLMKKFGPFRPTAVTYSLIAIAFPAIWQTGRVLDSISYEQAMARRAERLRQAEIKEQERIASPEYQASLKAKAKRDEAFARTSPEEKELMRRVRNAMSELGAERRANRPLDDEQVESLLDSLISGEATEFEFTKTLDRIRPKRLDEATRTKVVEQVNLMLGSDNRAIRKAAIEASPKWRNDSTAEILIGLLNDPSQAKLHEEIIQALGKFDTPESSMAVAERLFDPKLKSASLWVIRDYEGSHVEDALLAAIKTHGAETDFNVIQVLSSIGTEKSKPVFNELRSSKSRLMRMAAEDALRKIEARKNRP